MLKPASLISHEYLVKYYSVAASAEFDAVLSSTLFLHFTDVICLLFTQTELKGTVDVI